MADVVAAEIQPFLSLIDYMTAFYNVDDRMKNDHHAITPIDTPRPQKPKRKRIRNNSERGKKYRAKKKQYEEGLELATYNLRQEIADLVAKRSVCLEKAVLTRLVGSGSLARTVNEYFSIFQHGMPSIGTEERQIVEAKRALLTAEELDYEQKKAFLYQVMKPDVAKDGDIGIDALIKSLQRMTLAFDYIDVKLVHIGDITELEERATVSVRVDVHVRLSHAPLARMFPAVEHNSRLARKLVGTDITLENVGRFHFAADGRVESMSMDVNFVGAFLKVLGSPSDVAELMQRKLPPTTSAEEGTRTKSKAKVVVCDVSDIDTGIVDGDVVVDTIPSPSSGDEQNQMNQNDDSGLYSPATNQQNKMSLQHLLSSEPEQSEPISSDGE